MPSRLRPPFGAAAALAILSACGGLEVEQAGEGTPAPGEEQAASESPGPITGPGDMPRAVASGVIELDGEVTHEGVTVTAYDPADATRFQTAITAPDGHYRIYHLTAGTWIVRADKTVRIDDPVNVRQSRFVSNCTEAFEVSPGHVAAGEDKPVTLKKLTLIPLYRIAQFLDSTGASVASTTEDFLTVKLNVPNIDAMRTGPDVNALEDQPWAEPATEYRLDTRLAGCDPEAEDAPCDGFVRHSLQFRLRCGIETPRYTAYILVDRTPPYEPAIWLGDGRGVTNDPDGKVLARFFALDDLAGVVSMKVSINGKDVTQEREPFVLQKTLDLGAQDGPKLVKAVFYDGLGNESPATAASIILDREAPEPASPFPLAFPLAVNGAVGARETLVSLYASGAAAVALANEPGPATFQSFSRQVSWTLAEGPDGPRRVYAVFADEAGNRSPEVSGAVNLATTGAVMGRAELEDREFHAGVRVRVTALARSAVSDATGRFTLSALPAGPWNLAFEATGFTRPELAVTVRPNDATDIGTVFIPRARTGVHGRIELADGGDPADTLVWLDIDGDATRRLLTAAGATGQWAFAEVPAGKHGFEVWRAYYTPIRSPIHVAAGQVFDAGTITLNPQLGSVVVPVRAAGPTPETPATVTVIGTPLLALTAVPGDAALHGVPAGYREIRAELAGFAPAQTGIMIIPETAVTASPLILLPEP